MRVFLIRHGETVDNVAGLYAGVRDSALTSHGVLQARRLAEHVASILMPASDHIGAPAQDACFQSRSEVPPSVSVFSSNLSRAVKTAEAIVDALKCRNKDPPPLVQLAELREKNFGTGEGTKFGASRKGIGARSEDHIGAETREDLRVRADCFVNDHLLPLLQSRENDQGVCIVVSHGLLLGALIKSLCAKVTVENPSGISMSPEVESSRPQFAGGPPILPGWSNTGYLEARLTKFGNDALKMHIFRANCTSHLAGLKKTQGGIGSSKFDEKQKLISSFFTKHKSPSSPSSSSSSPRKKRRLDGEE